MSEEMCKKVSVSKESLTRKYGHFFGKDSFDKNLLTEKYANLLGKVSVDQPGKDSVDQDSSTEYSEDIGKDSVDMESLSNKSENLGKDSASMTSLREKNENLQKYLASLREKYLSMTASVPSTEASVVKESSTQKLSLPKIMSDTLQGSHLSLQKPSRHISNEFDLGNENHDIKVSKSSNYHHNYYLQTNSPPIKRSTYAAKFFNESKLQNDFKALKINIESKALNPNIESKALKTNIESKALKSNIDSKPLKSNIESKPLKTYIESKPLKTYIESKPLKTNIESKPLKTYIESKPLKTNIESKPLKTYIESKPLKTNIESKPLKTYIESKPLKTNIKDKLLKTNIEFKQLKRSIECKALKTSTGETKSCRENSREGTSVKQPLLKQTNMKSRAEKQNNTGWQRDMTTLGPKLKLDPRELVETKMDKELIAFSTSFLSGSRFCKLNIPEVCYGQGNITSNSDSNDRENMRKSEIHTSLKTSIDNLSIRSEYCTADEELSEFSYYEEIEQTATEADEDIFINKKAIFKPPYEKLDIRQYSMPNINGLKEDPQYETEEECGKAGIGKMKTFTSLQKSDIQYSVPKTSEILNRPTITFEDTHNETSDMKSTSYESKPEKTSIKSKPLKTSNESKPLKTSNESKALKTSIASTLLERSIESKPEKINIEQDKSVKEYASFENINTIQEAMNMDSNKDSVDDDMQPVEVYVMFPQMINTPVDNSYIISNWFSEVHGVIKVKPLMDPTLKTSITVIYCRSLQVAEIVKETIRGKNRKSETKIWCFDSVKRAKAAGIWLAEENEISLKVHLSAITRSAEEAAGKHCDKIVDVQDKIKKKEHYEPTFLNKHMDNKASLAALIDKEKELKMQKAEFYKYLSNCTEDLKKAKYSINFEKSAEKIRQNFSVECNRLANTLPIYARRSDILKTVEKNQVSVIIGETGSGKSTQMAQYFYYAGLALQGMIACTQPRKIAATSLATQVAKEMKTRVGNLVGYKVGMQARWTHDTKILYMTDHMLLNECLKDRELSAYSCIIIDEAHERSIYTDLLLGMIKECLQKRPELRVIITSATINPDVFVNYFKGCPVLTVSGRMFPVEVIWEKRVGRDCFQEYQNKAVKMAINIHNSQDDGDILVFLTKPVETERCSEKFIEMMSGKPNNFVALQLHGRLEWEKQQKVFEPPPTGKRKIVFATNCAETSVTIPGIKFVIDTGLVNEMKFDPILKMSTLAVTMVTQSAARQRRGRAGRLGPGKCYCLYTEENFKNMTANSLPEILKVHIGHALLKLMELGVNPMEFNFIESPSIESMKEAFNSLIHIGAVAENQITNLGKWVAKMPFDPQYGAFVYEAMKEGLAIEAIIIASANGITPVFFRAGTNEEKDLADRLKTRFCHEGGDQLTTLNVFREWYQIHEEERVKWCHDNYINGKSVKTIRETTKEVLNILKNELNVHVDFTFNEQNEDDKLSNLLLRALSRNLSHYLGHTEAGYYIISKDQRVDPHPSSAFLALGMQPEWIVFDQVIKTSREFAVQITPVPEDSIQKGIRDGWLHFDIQEVKDKQMNVMCLEYVGSQLFRRFVGPCYKYKLDFEAELIKSYPDLMITVEADEEKGKLRVLASECTKSILSNESTLVSKDNNSELASKSKLDCVGTKSKLSDNSELASKSKLDCVGTNNSELASKSKLECVGTKLKLDSRSKLTCKSDKSELAQSIVKIINPIRNKYMLERREFGEIFGPADFGRTAVLGSGGCTKNILLPDEYREVIICCPVQERENITVTIVQAKFEVYGLIDECIEFSTINSTIWGKVVYENPISAKAAVDGTRGGPNPTARPAKRKNLSKNTMFKATITWCRRNPKGSAYVKFAKRPHFLRAIRLKNFIVGNSMIYVEPGDVDNSDLGINKFLSYEDDNLNSICIKGLNKSVTEEDVLKLLSAKLGINPRRDIKKVVVFRTKAELKMEVVDKHKDKLQRKILEFSDKDNFQLTIEEPRTERDISFTGYCLFKYPEEGEAACCGIDQVFSIDDNVVSMKSDIHNCVLINREVYSRYKNNIESHISKIDGDEIKIKHKVMRNKNVELEIHTKSTDALHCVLADIQKITVGEIIECGGNMGLLHLFSREGGKKIWDIKRKTDVVIIRDNNLLTISIHGEERQRKAAMTLIDEFVELHNNYISCCVQLKGEGRPPGIMKALLQEYHHDLSDLKTQADLQSVKLDLRFQKLAMLGSQEAVDKANDMINGVLSKITTDGVIYKMNNPICVLCLSDIQYKDIYRLEYCGHPYCKKCIQLQVNTAINSTNFPITCKKCLTEFVWRDFNNLTLLGLMKMADLVDASIKAYV